MQIESALSVRKVMVSLCFIKQYVVVQKRNFFFFRNVTSDVMIGFLLLLKRINGRWHCLNEGYISLGLYQQWKFQLIGIGFFLPTVISLLRLLLSLANEPILIYLPRSPFLSVKPSSSLYPFTEEDLFLGQDFITYSRERSILKSFYSTCTDVCLDDGLAIVFKFLAKQILPMKKKIHLVKKKLAKKFEVQIIFFASFRLCACQRINVSAKREGRKRDIT